MPIYEYRCDKCEHEFEREQRITADPVKTCPACRSRRVKRLISRTSFVLKGGGWYSDLYSSGSKAKAGDSGDSGGEGTAGKDSTAKSDTSDSKSSEKSSAKKDSSKGGKKASKSSQPAA
ncbi:MAG: zinc ribbon domain-containing protein [Myxococcota bacterium]